MKYLIVIALWFFHLGAIAQTSYTFGINEGATTAGGIEIAAKYKPLVDYLSKNLKVTLALDPVSSIKRSDERVRAGKYDIVFGKTVNLLATVIRDKDYRPVVKRETPYESAFIVNANSKVQSLQDIGDAVVYTPNPRAFTSKLALASLKESNILLKPEQLKHTDSQEAVPFALSHGFGDVGVVNPTIVNPTIAKKWKESGGKVIYTTKPMPNWTIIVSSHVSAEHADKLRDLMVELKNSADGRAILQKIGVEAFVPAARDEYIALLKYIES